MVVIECSGPFEEVFKVLLWFAVGFKVDRSGPIGGKARCSHQEE